MVVNGTAQSGTDWQASGLQLQKFEASSTACKLGSNSFRQRSYCQYFWQMHRGPGSLLTKRISRGPQKNLYIESYVHAGHGLTTLDAHMTHICCQMVRLSPTTCPSYAVSCWRPGCTPMAGLLERPQTSERVLVLGPPLGVESAFGLRSSVGNLCRRPCVKSYLRGPGPYTLGASMMTKLVHQMPQVYLTVILAIIKASLSLSLPMYIYMYIYIYTHACLYVYEVGGSHPKVVRKDSPLAGLALPALHSFWFRSFEAFSVAS